MAATSHPLAVEAAIRVLRQGGSAADAAVAANAVMGVVEPMSCGVGGDLFAIYWNAETESLHGLNASGRSPYALNRQVFADQGLDQIPESGPLSWSVPGCVSGWGDLHAKFGRLAWADLFDEAIYHAEQGHAVPPVIAGYWSGAERSLAQWPNSAATLLTAGKAPRVGEVFRNPALAATYRKIAADGPEVFYRGPIAAEIVRASGELGGLFSEQDFADHQNEWVEPVGADYRGYRVWELPPNGQGIAALQILNVMEGIDVGGLGWGHPDVMHRFIEAKKLAFADRARFYADPDFYNAPVAELISKEYAARQSARIDDDRAAAVVPPGDPAGHGDTIYLTVVDADRNCCSLIQSLYFGFGSKVVPGDVGFPIQNRGALFALDPNHANTLEPHKRPFHTIIPAMVAKDGRPWLTFGVMGGDMQPQGHAQVVMNLIDHGMDVQLAGDAARVRHDGSATPTGIAGDAAGGVVYYEPGVPAATIEELARRGHVLKEADGGGMGGYQAILIDWDQGVLHGGTESRKDGAAAGY